MIIVQHGVICNACGDRIFSNMRLDFVRCRCQRTFIDGGFDMRRIGYQTEDGMPREVTRKLPAMPTSGYRTQHSGPHKKKEPA